MRNSFVLFEVSMEIAWKKFHSSKKDAEKISFSVSKSQVANEKMISATAVIVTMLFQIVMPLPLSLVFDKTLPELIATMLSKWYKYSI